MKEYRRTLRRNQTVTEKIVWNEVRNRRFLGLKIKRQFSIYSFIVDFYIPEKKVIIEIDGDTHLHDPETIARDKALARFCDQNEYTLIRFTNEQILGNLNACFVIDSGVEGVIE